MVGSSAFGYVIGSIDGIGKLVGVSKGRVEVEYFVSPANSSVHRVSVPIADVREVELSPQTRVFYFDTKHAAWIAGRVDGGLIGAEALRATEDHYHVRFPNGHEERVPISGLYVRWSHPVEDPTDYLAGRVTGTPYFFDGRSRIVRYLSWQRAAFGGLTALASSAIELLPHQVSIVRRVLADPIERYLLADEVGLGKTIEAGILIRQHVIDHPNDAQVLVVVPRHLVHQWKSELAEKFFLTINGPITVVSEDDLHDSCYDTDFTMLVVDEAHRPALRAFDLDLQQRRLYERLRTLAERVPRVLLLSGTPVLHQEDGFLAMLHLLDPVGYPLEEREPFRRRVRDRQAIAEAIADLEDDASPFFVDEAINRLEGLFADDSRLIKLCRAVRAFAQRDINDKERIRGLRALRTHVAETYRLHRRLLRTRRDDPRLRDYLPQRTGVRVLEHQDHARDESIDFIEAWRLAISTREGTAAQRAIRESLFQLWVESALSHPRVLLRRLDSRLALRSGRNISIPEKERELLASDWAFDDEKTLIRERRQLIVDSLEQDMRTLRLLDWLQSSPDVSKVILFVDDKEVADLVSSKLKGTLGTDIVIRHEVGGGGLRDFQERKTARVLVCDASAEEGLNLQRFGAAIVHYDLPLEPARIEQRIGRVDRIEARGRMRNIVLSSNMPYEREWLKCLTNTVRVFDRSVAPLQYVLLEATSNIRSRLLLEGPVAIEAEETRMGDQRAGIEAELRRIRAQEMLDSVEVDPEREAEFFQKLVESDEATEEEGEGAFHSWVVERLQFSQRKVEEQGLRYVHVSDDRRPPTLVPMLEVARRFASCIDRDPNARQRRTELPLQTFTFERVVAEKNCRISLLRVGHPFVDALEALVRADDRGTAFAMWRHAPGVGEIPQLYYRFDFVIEANIEQASTVMNNYKGAIEALRRRADEVFPVEYRTIWLDSDLKEVSDKRILATLGLPYSQKPRSDGGRDTNVRLGRWAKADTLVPVGDWGDLCYRACKTAERLLREERIFQDRCQLHGKKVHDVAVSVDDALRSRIERLTGATRKVEESMAVFEWDTSQALAKGIETPSLRLDSTGAVFLSGTPWVEE